MLNKYLVLVAVLLVTALASKLYSEHVDAVSEARKQGKAEVVQEYNREYVEGLEQQILSSKSLLAKANKTIEENEIKRKADNARYEHIISSLRNRPLRSEANIDSSSPSVSTCSSTGAGLYREDGEFLAGEAAEAAEIVRERDYYYRSLKELTEELEQLNGKK